MQFFVTNVATKCRALIKDSVKVKLMLTRKGQKVVLYMYIALNSMLVTLVYKIL